MSDNHTATLLQSLMQEFFQTETSASKHCRREASRYADTPPAEALRAVAGHADEVLKQLPTLAKQEGLDVGSGLASSTGAMLSQLRDKLLDRVIQAERSYRGTLLGIRHGLDLVLSLRHVAETVGNEAIFDFCESWLVRRSVLTARVEEELVWFARHPAAAVHRPTTFPLRHLTIPVAPGRT